MSKIITVANQKGGVGKTTTSLALASGLARKGFRVLAVDLDPQANMTLSSGISPLLDYGSLYDVFKGQADAKDTIQKSDLKYDVMPGGINLAGADMDFTQTGREFMLKETLQELDEGYDFIVIDTAPTLGILTVNALTAASVVIIPMAVDIYSLQGLSQLNMLINNVKKYCNPQLEIGGLLVTKWVERQTLSSVIFSKMQEAAKEIGAKIYDSKIRESVALRKVAVMQADMYEKANKANATKDYSKFIEELMKGGIDRDK